MQDDIARMKNTQSEEKTNSELNDANQSSMTSEALALAKETAKKEKQRTTTTWLIITIIVVFGIFGLVIDSEYKKKYGKSIIDGGLTFKRH
jgi:heme/copper-type cytochrome/quinol oxidase subunit 3